VGIPIINNYKWDCVLLNNWKSREQLLDQSTEKRWAAQTTVRMSRQGFRCSIKFSINTTKMATDFSRGQSLNRLSTNLQPSRSSRRPRERNWMWRLTSSWLSWTATVMTKSAKRSSTVILDSIDLLFVIFSEIAINAAICLGILWMRP